MKDKMQTATTLKIKVTEHHRKVLLNTSGKIPIIENKMLGKHVPHEIYGHVKIVCLTLDSVNTETDLKFHIQYLALLL